MTALRETGDDARVHHPARTVAARHVSRDAVHQVGCQLQSCETLPARIRAADLQVRATTGHAANDRRVLFFGKIHALAKRKKPSDQSLFDRIDATDGSANAAASIGGTARARRQRRSARGGAVAVPELRAVGHHGARAAGRARRPQAGAAPHPLHDVAAESDRRRQAPQVREGRRRRDGQLPSARRRGAVRDARPDGAVVLAALSAGGRVGQLRLARRRQRRRHALHGVPARAHQRRDAHRDRADDGPFPAELRRHQDRAGGAAGAAFRTC